MEFYLNFVIGQRQCFGKKFGEVFFFSFLKDINFKFLLNIKIQIYALYFLAEICVLYWT